MPGAGLKEAATCRKKNDSQWGIPLKKVGWEKKPQEGTIREKRERQAV